MLQDLFLQLNEQGAYDLLMQIGQFFEGFHYKMVDFASSVFGMFGF